MATYAGRYDEALLRRAGNRIAPAAANTTVLVYESDGSTVATLYADRTKATTAANPVDVDASGNLEFFAEPGTYVIAIRENGVQVDTDTVTVHADPVEALFGDGASTASALSIIDAGGHFAGTDVEAALQELGNAAYAYVVDAAFGDGVTNARAAIQAKIDLASADGGGTVVIPAGTFMVDMVQTPGFAGFYSALTVPSKVRLFGVGMGATTVKLIANEPRTVTAEGASIITNADLDGVDTDIEIGDLTVDGNAANQAGVQNGIVFIRTRRAKCSRVKVANCRGTASSGAAETFHFDTQLGLDTTYTDCLAVGDAGSTASGFSANQATNVGWKGCTAYGMTVSMGFTHFDCENVAHDDCIAYLCGTNGFNSEESRNVSYASCHAGGEVAAGDNPALAAGTSLGNAASGFVINGTRNAVLAGCTSRKNVQSGLAWVEGTQGTSGRMSACALMDNGFGVSCSSAVAVARWYVDNTTLVDGNTTAEFDLPTGYTAGLGSQLATPAMPASGTAFANPYPFSVTVYITAPGTITLLRVNGADLDTSTKSMRLLPGMTINIFYSSAPSWLWFAD